MLAAPPAPRRWPWTPPLLRDPGLGALDYLTPDYRAPIAAAATLDELPAAAAWKGAGSPLAQHNPLAGSYSVSKAALNR